MEARIPIRVLKKGAKAADAEASVLSGTAKCREKPISPCGRERGHVGKIAARETGRLFVGNPWQAYVERSMQHNALSHTGGLRRRPGKCAFPKMKIGRDRPRR